MNTLKLAGVFGLVTVISACSSSSSGEPGTTGASATTASTSSGGGGATTGAGGSGGATTGAGGGGGATTGAGGGGAVGEDVAGTWDTFDEKGNLTNETTIHGKIVLSGTFTSPLGPCTVDSAKETKGTVGVNEGSGLGDQKLGVLFNTTPNAENGVTFTLKDPGPPTVGKAYGRDDLDGLNFSCKGAGGTVSLATSQEVPVWSKFEVVIAAFDPVAHTLTASVDWVGTQGADTEFSVQGQLVVTGP